jgi:FkbM family methyltransferase
MKNLYFFRKVLRALGLTKILGNFYASEKRFGSLMLSSISNGDTVWDVGANVGLYVPLFLERVGPSGALFAFEPNPNSFNILKEKFGHLERLKVVNMGLGDVVSSMPLYVNSDPTSVTASLSPNHVDDFERTRTIHYVDITTGDSFAIKHGTPDIVKIDVEGFEVEVLRGLKEVLSSRVIRHVCIEVHFREMENRGVLEQFWDQDQYIINCGYTAKWVDPSHVIYTK